MEGYYGSGVVNAQTRMAKIIARQQQISQEMNWIVSNMSNPNVVFTPQLKAQFNSRLARLQNQMNSLNMQYQSACQAYMRACNSAAMHEQRTAMANQNRLMRDQMHAMYGRGGRRGW